MTVAWRMLALLRLLVAFGGTDTISAVLSTEISPWGIATPRCTNHTDCTPELQAAFSSSASVVNVLPLPGGRPWVVTPLHLLHNNTVVIFRPGVHVQAKRGSYHGITDCLINIFNVHNVTVIAHGARFSMWKDDYTNASLYRPAQWRHAFWITGNMGPTQSLWHGNAPTQLAPCGDIAIEGGEVSATGGDAVQIECDRVVVRGMHAHNNYRQGISVLGAVDSLFEDCTFTNTSGHAPGSGLQIEPWHFENVVQNVTIRRCRAYNNQGSGFCVALGELNGSSLPTSVAIEDCSVGGTKTIAGLAVTSPNPAVQGTVSVNNLSVAGTACYGALIYNHAAGRNHTVSIRSSDFDGVALPSTCKASNEPSPIGIGYVSWQPPPPGRIGGIDIKQTRIHDTFDRPFLLETTAGAMYKAFPHGVEDVHVNVTRTGPFSRERGCGYTLQSAWVANDVNISCTAADDPSGWSGRSLLARYGSMIKADDQEAVCNVRVFGAKGDGHTLDTSSINDAISAPACASRRIVLSAGIFRSGTLRLRSHLHLTIEPSAVLLGGGSGTFDPAEENPFDVYQDFGHSHWRCAMLHGANVTNITVDGGGLIDGGVYGSTYGLRNAAPVPTGDADKVFGVVSSSYISVMNISMKRTGHFAFLLTDVEHVTLRDLTLHPHRDGVDLVGVRHFSAERLLISGGGDDAFVLKSDFSIGRYINCENITVRNSSISSVGATALEIGSETAGNFSGILWENIEVHSAGDAAIGIVNMDGGHVSDVRYHNITANNVTSPLQFYLGARRLCGCPSGPPATPWSQPCGAYPPGVPRPVGSIRNIVVDRMIATDIHGLAHGGRNWTATVDGQPESDQDGVTAAFARLIGPNITLSRLQWTYLGGGNDSSTAPPHKVNGWMNSESQTTLASTVFFHMLFLFLRRRAGVGTVGPRPAYGFFLRNCKGVTVDGFGLEWESAKRPERRPAFVIENASEVSFLQVEAERPPRLGYDVLQRHGCRDIHAPGLVVRDTSSVP